jgi:hypothetical protein
MDICSAILAINPSAECSVRDQDFSQITWLKGTTPISKSDIQAKQAELKAVYDAKEYQRDRVKSGGYASIGDQLDMQYKDLLNGTTIWKDHVAKVKSDFPKPE